MPFCVIAGTTVAMQSFAEQEPLYAGEEVRAFNNALLSSLRAPKRRWRGQTRPYVYTEFAAVRTATANGAFVACSGDAFQGTTPTCRVKITEMPYESAKRKTTDNSINALLYEVVYNLDFEEV